MPCKSPFGVGLTGFGWACVHLFCLEGHYFNRARNWQRLSPSGFTLYTLPLDFTKVGNVSGYYVGRLVVVVVVGRVNQHSSWYLHLLE
jgi:hypothetical protein